MNLALPPSRAQLEPSLNAAQWARVEFQPVLDSCQEQPSIVSLKVSRAADGWELELKENDWTLDVRLAKDWSYCSSNGVVQPILCSGGWSTTGSLQVSLIFVESPHRLNLSCDLEERSVTAIWVTPPLHPGPLRDLRVKRAGPVTWLTPQE